MTAALVAGPAGGIFADDGGRGDPPVVLLHSLAGNTGHWQAQLAHLRRRRRAVALDFRAHGRSDPASDGDYRIESFAADLAAVADRLGLERFALVGHSLGGGVALAYAGANPERVERLLVVDAIGDSTQLPAAVMEPFLAALESPAYAETIEGYWAGIAGPDPGVKQRLLRDLRATPPEAVVAALHAVARFDPSPALAAYRGPVRAIVTPSNDESWSLHRLGSGFPHAVVEGTGHWLQLDRPEEFHRLLDLFLSDPA